MRFLTSRSWLAWLAIAFGGLWAISMAQDIDAVAETRHWPTTPGTMVDSHISSEQVGTYVGKYSNHPVYAARLSLRYVYDVAGSRYNGWRWNALPATANQARDAMVRKYPPGDGVVVHYDPHDPSSAVLDTSWPILKCVQLAVALILMIAVWSATGRRRRVTA